MYRDLTEHNGWENETWTFFIPIKENEESLELLKEKLKEFDLNNDGEDIYFELGKEDFSEHDVDILTKYTRSGYMDDFNKLEGKLIIPDWKDYEDCQDSLYKGGIKDLMI